MSHLPELLYLLAGDSAELAQHLSTMRPANVADALNQLKRPPRRRCSARSPST